MKKYILLVLISTLLCACSADEPDYNVPAAVNAAEGLKKVDTTLVYDSYEGEEAKPEEALERFASEDGLCVIEKKPSYYEVWLYHDKGDPYDVGCAYAEAILETGMDYAEVLEPYLYENIDSAFPNLDGEYTPVIDRINLLKPQIPEEYVQELEGFATILSGGLKGMEADGKLSYEEVFLASMVPDCLRGTNCNALSVWGEKSVTGERIISRTMDWPMGSTKQMCTAQAVTHFIMGEGKNSYTAVAVLGMLDVLTGLNDKGVFAAMLDAGSGNDYVCEGKKCYSFELRYALEKMNDARSLGEYMVAESKNFTFSHNIIVTDKNDCFVAEDCADTSESSTGQSILRDKDTPLMDGIHWDNPDSLCVVNAFQSEGADDAFTSNGNNYIRFCKYNAWTGEKEKLSVADVKSIVTRESIKRDSGWHNIYSYLTYHIVIYDYATGKLNICFTGPEGQKDHPVFTEVPY
ncbi:MAG: hypothetical protein IKO11_09015 [Lachnospiraceae bacterium]|nr:hypothetical protein [Lachnospiraceae bacterium]